MMKVARRKLEVPMPAAMPCKISIKSSGQTHRSIGKRKTKHACVACAEKHETKARREQYTNITKIISLKRGEFYESLQSCSQIHSDASNNETSRCKGSGKRINWRKFRAWQLTKVRNKKVIEKQGQKQKSSFCVIDGSVSSQEFGVGTSISKKYKGRVVLRGDMVKDDSGSYAVFSELGSSTSQMTAAKVKIVLLQ